MPLHLLVEIGFVPLTLVLLVIMIYIFPKIEKIPIILQRLETLEEMIGKVIEISIKKNKN